MRCDQPPFVRDRDAERAAPEARAPPDPDGFSPLSGRSGKAPPHDRQFDLQNDSGPRRHHTERGPESVRARCDVTYRDTPSPFTCGCRLHAKRVANLSGDVCLYDIGCAIWVVVRRLSRGRGKNVAALRAAAIVDDPSLRSGSLLRSRRKAAHPLR